MSLDLLPSGWRKLFLRPICQLNLFIVLSFRRFIRDVPRQETVLLGGGLLVYIRHAERVAIIRLGRCSGH